MKRIFVCVVLLVFTCLYAQNKGPVVSVKDSPDNNCGTPPCQLACGNSEYALLVSAGSAAGEMFCCSSTTQVWTYCGDSWDVRHLQWSDGAHPARSVAQNTAAIQAAFTAAASSEEREVRFRDSYVVTDLTVPDGVSIKCFGDGSGLEADAGTTTLLSYAGSPTDTRAKAIERCSFSGGDLTGGGGYGYVTTILSTGHAANLHIVGNRFENAAEVGSVCVEVDGLQNSLVELNEWRNCERLVRFSDGPANVVFMKNEGSRSTLQHAVLEEACNGTCDGDATPCEVDATCVGHGGTETCDCDGENCHGLTFIQNLWERERTGNGQCRAAGVPKPCCSGLGTGTCSQSPYPEPDIGFLATGCRDVTVIGDRVATPTQSHNWNFVGSAGVTLPAGQYGARDFTLIDVGSNISNNDASAECTAGPPGIPYACCNGDGPPDTGCDNDWQTGGSGMCGIYVDGANDIYIASAKNNNSNTRCWLHPEAASATRVTVGPGIQNDALSAPGPDMINGESVFWIDPQVNTQSWKFEAKTDDATQPRYDWVRDSVLEWSMRASANGLELWDLVTNEQRILVSTTAEGNARIRGTAPAWQWLDTDFPTRVAAEIRAPCSGDPDCDIIFEVTEDDTAGTEVGRYDSSIKTWLFQPDMRLGRGTTTDIITTWDDDDQTDPTFRWDPNDERFRLYNGGLDLYVAFDTIPGKRAGLYWINSTLAADPVERRAFFGVDADTGMDGSQSDIVLTGWTGGTEKVLARWQRNGGVLTLSSNGVRFEGDNVIELWPTSPSATAGISVKTTGSGAGQRFMVFDDSIPGWEMDTNGVVGTGSDFTFDGTGTLALADKSKFLGIDTDRNTMREAAWGRFDYVGVWQPGGRDSSQPVVLGDHSTDPICHIQEVDITRGMFVDTVEVEVATAFAAGDCDIQLLHINDALGNSTTVLSGTTTQDLDWTGTGVKSYTLSSRVFLEPGVYYTSIGCADNASAGALSSAVDGGGNVIPVREALYRSGTNDCFTGGAMAIPDPPSAIEWDSFRLADSLWLRLSYAAQHDKLGVCSTTTTVKCILDSECPGVETCVVQCKTGGSAC